MILLDVNLLVYAYDANSRQHTPARQWWENQLNGSQMIGLSWVAVLGFIRLLTNPRIYQQPYSAEDVVIIVDSWLQQPHVKIIHPSD